MGERTSVERSITEAMLQTGEISLGPVEQRRLDLGDHSTSLMVSVDGGQLPVVWTAGRRRLSGEDLLEYLQETARVGDLLRLERRDRAGIELVVHTPLTSFSRTAPGWSMSAATLPTGSPDVAAAASSPRINRVRRTSRGQRYRLRQREEYAWHGNVGFLKEAQNHLLKALRERGWDPAEAMELRLEGERLATLDEFDELLALDAAHIEHMPHQEAAARTVLTRMGGRAVLADEVGLGKTVEAGLILKELLLRGLAERILIVCPAPLRDQWRDELREKFDEEFVVVATGQNPAAFHGNRMIMTHHLLLRNAYQLPEPFDLVVIDEAHRLATSGAKRSREVIGDLVAQAPRTLFLTATPVQNNLLELYRLVELLRPGTFVSERDFIARFVGDDPRRPVNPTELRKLVSSVVVRTTRQQAGVDKVHRMPPLDRPVKLTDPERQLYDLLLHTLRHRMTALGDTMRRRQLALRLTASPQAVSRSALRMAERHLDPAVREILTEIGHLAGDIHHTAREQAALQVLRPWLDEHGRVLVFTQHTETLHGILRLLDGEGISAVAFHGSMSHTARAESVANFRAGRAAVLVSTDAGAEGQNLQVSNCVLNYDLPWNPMRVEQRIGRVHRLTQTRDVHIANLFARDTLDESVYRLLHDKLAMFELLFGQVVTVLGELDGNQDSSMEDRVLQALYEKSDLTMRSRLDELGRELEQARSRAMQMMSADSGLSQWLAQQHEERRARAAQPEATELLPQPADRPRRRQKDLEQFICLFLSRAGATLEHPAEGFTIVTLLADLSTALDGRQQLYLAFTNAALDAHPDAELCVVGSEVFDELLAALRVRGDLIGSVPRIPAVHQQPTIAHVAEVRLVQRRLEPTDDWSARATYRLQEGATAGNQRLVTVEVGRPLPPDADREPLPDGAPLPVQLGEQAVLDVLERAATGQLGGELEQARQAERQRQQEANQQLIGNLKQQLAEAELQWRNPVGGHWQMVERYQQLRRAIEAAENATVREEHTELRAELLTLELHGSDRLRVVEQWEHTQGIQREIRYEWSGDPADHQPTCEATGEPIRTLALCADAHVVDATALVPCHLCGQHRCAACDAQHAVRACVACRRGVCGICRKHSGLCEECGQPERAPDLDGTWERGWRLGGGAALLVGVAHAVLTTPDGTRTTLVPDVELNDPVRVRIRALAVALGLPPAAGLIAADVPSTAQVTDGAVWAQVETSQWWTTALDGGTRIEHKAIPALPNLSGPPTNGENALGLATLLADLRRRDVPPDPPALVEMPFVAVRRVDLVDGQFVYRELWHDGTGEARLAAQDSQPLTLSWHEVRPLCRPVARATVGPITIEIDGLHRSYICRLTDGTHNQNLFVPGAPRLQMQTEEQFARMVAAAGLSPERAVVLHPWRGANASELTYPLAAPGVRVRREVTDVWTLVDADDGEPPTDPIVAGGRLSEFAQAARVDDVRLRETLEQVSSRLSPVALVRCLAVEEHWRSPDGVAVRRYLVAPAAPIDRGLVADRTLVAPGEILPAAPEDGAAADVPLSVDSCGHLYDAAHGWSCPACTQVYGPCCHDDGTIAPCRTCRRPACNACRTARRDEISETRCERCGDYSCADCSRRLVVRLCGLCARASCPECMDAELCQTCAQLVPASPGELTWVPAELAADGLSVLIGHDEGGSIALLVGRWRAELALFSPSGVQRWETMRDEPPAVLQSRIHAAHISGTGDVELQVLDCGTPQHPADELVLERHSDSRVLWLVESDGVWKAGNSPRPAGTPSYAKFDGAMLAEVQRSMAQVAPPPGSLPTPMPASRAEVARRIASGVEQPRGHAVLVVSLQQTEHAVALGARGLTRRHSEGASASEQTAEWRPNHEAPDWAYHGWRPRPELVAVASLDDYTAVIAAHGHHAMLGVRHADKAPAWYLISEDREDLLRAALGTALLGRPVLLSVGAMTPRTALHGPTVLGARPETRTIAPDLTMCPTSATEVSTIPPASALAEVGAPEPTVPPSRGTLLTTLAASLRDRVIGRDVERTWGGIGLRVQEQWRLATGEPALVNYRVPAGEGVAWLPDAVTGRPLRAVALCRMHHTVEQVDVCTHCRTGTCGACADQVRPCALCGGQVCGRCLATPDGRCPACATLRKAGMFERRRLAARGGTAWQGVSSQSQVIVRYVNNQWSVERVDHAGQTSVVLNDEKLRLVQRLLGPPS